MSKKTRKTRARRPTTSNGRGSVDGLPTASLSHQLEDRSRTLFAEAITPWPLVAPWVVNDYGIDSIVEITRARTESSDRAVTGKRFAVQLKATGQDWDPSKPLRFRVGKDKIRYWLGSTEPVLFVGVHVPSERLFWRWIDDRLIDELTRIDQAWIAADTVRISLPQDQVLDRQSLPRIESWVLDHHRAQRRLLTPGSYFRMQRDANAAAALLVDAAAGLKFSSIASRLTALHDSLQRATYVVAITGPLRAGKSTLTNSLIGRDISPVGRKPTTAVPILILGGDADVAEVAFLDHASQSGEAAASFLETYATQEGNPDNAKKVSMVTVRLISERLERGIAYADAPGLHDPSPEIRQITDKALKAAHAIIYVLDVSTARDGGFSLTDSIVADLRRFQSSADRLFLVLNKADRLDDESKSEVQRYLDEELRKYDLASALPTPPLFISASEAWLYCRSGDSGISPLEPLENAVWDHLLSTNSTGVDRVKRALADLSIATQDFSALVSARLARGTRATRIREALARCEQTRDALRERCKRRPEVDREFARRTLASWHTGILGWLEDWLRQFPLASPLPNATTLRQEVNRNILAALQATWREVATRLQAFGSEVSAEVESSLQAARSAIGLSEGIRFLIPDLETLDDIPADSKQEAWAGLIAGGAFALAIGAGALGFLIAGVGWLVGAEIGKERRRSREIARIRSRVEVGLSKALVTINHQLREKIDLFAVNLRRQVDDRMTPFVEDAKRQLSTLGAPLNAEETAVLRTAQDAVAKAAALIENIESSLRSGAL